MTKPREANNVTLDSVQYLLLRQKQENQDQTQGGLAPTGAFSLWQMMLSLLKYARTRIVADATMQAETSKVQTQLFSNLYDIGSDVGKFEADQLDKQALGQYIQGGLALGAGALTLGSAGYANSKISSLDDETKDLNTMEAAIKNPLGGIEGEDAQMNRELQEEEQPGLPEEKEDEDVLKVVDNWTRGTKRLDRYSKGDPLLNEKAANLIGNDQEKADKVLGNIRSSRESIEKDKNAADMNHNSRSQLAQLVNQGASGVTGGITTNLQQTAVKNKANANSGNAVLSQVTQANGEQERKYQSNGEAALQEINQEATQLAQALAAGTH